MPVIFELFGFQLGLTSQNASQSVANAHCPFMNAPCDGGGNRHLSKIELRTHPELKLRYPNREAIHSGVCSISTDDSESPWIVCPRRLLALGHSPQGLGSWQDAINGEILKLLPQRKCRVGVWSEVKMKANEGQKSFDYTFDCILSELGFVEKEVVEDLLKRSWRTVAPELARNGHECVTRDGKTGIDTFPMGSPIILEIMTSSTSGGNKRNRSTVPMATEDALLGRSHIAPGINYRQVWARMVSQLIVKSEVGIAWGGRTFWLLQDKLVDYISQSTKLDMASFLGKPLSEVSILGLGYPQARPTDQPIDLTRIQLYSGPIASSNSATGLTFSDMVRAPFVPPLTTLQSLLLRRKRNGVLHRN